MADLIRSQQEQVRVFVQSGTGASIQRDTGNFSFDVETVTAIEPGTFRAESGYEPLRDTGRRGVDAMDLYVARGVGMSSISFSGNLRLSSARNGLGYMTPLGIFAANILATEDNYAVVVPGASATGIGGTAFPRTANPLVPVTDSDVFGLTSVHFLTLGNNNRYLTIMHRVGAEDDTNAFIEAFTDCKVTELKIMSNPSEDFVKWEVTLTGQERLLLDADPDGTNRVGMTLASYNSEMRDKATLDPPLEAWHGNVFTSGFAAGSTFDNRVMSAEWTLTRESTPFYGMDDKREYQELYLGSLEVTCSAVISVNNRAFLLNDYAGASSLTASKGTGDPPKIGRFGVIYRAEQGSGAFGAGEHGLAIGGEAFTLGDTKPTIDTSNVDPRLTIGARGLYSEAQVSNDLYGGAAIANGRFDPATSLTVPEVDFKTTALAGSTNELVEFDGDHQLRQNSPVVIAISHRMATFTAGAGAYPRRPDGSARLFDGIRFNQRFL